MNRKLPARQPLTLCALCAAVTLAASIGISAAAAAQPKKLNPPTALWKSFPLGTPLHQAERANPAVRKPSIRVTPTDRARVAAHDETASGRALTDKSQFPTGPLVPVLVAMLLGSTAILFLRRLTPVRLSVGRRRQKPVSAPAADDDLVAALRPQPILEFRATPPAQTVRPARGRIEPKRGSGPGVEHRPGGPVEAPRPFPAITRVPTIHEVLVERCEIKLWRGYAKYELYAANGPEDAWATSPPFRLRTKEAPDAAALQVLADLLADLERSGWKVVASGPAWYERRLERSVRRPDGDTAA
jgi:hypothetical protein